MGVAVFPGAAGLNAGGEAVDLLPSLSDLGLPLAGASSV